MAGPGCSAPDDYTTDHLAEDFRAMVPVPEDRAMVPTPEEPAATLPVAPNPIAEEVIESGDVLQVTIAAGLAAEDIVTVPTRVNDQGFLSLPEIGPIFVLGLGLPDAESAIRRAAMARSLYRDPLVTVVKKTSRPHLVTVLGAVICPGTYPLPGGARDIVSALHAAGGLAEEASDEVELTFPLSQGQSSRNLPNRTAHLAESNGSRFARTFEIQLTAYEAGDIPRQPLPHGAVIRVKSRKKVSIQVLGLVERPGPIEFSADEEFRLLDAIRQAEGIKNPNANRAVIERDLPDQVAPVLIQADLRQASLDSTENPRLMPGDIITVEERPLPSFWRFFQSLPWALNANDS